MRMLFLLAVVPLCACSYSLSDGTWHSIPVENGPSQIGVADLSSVDTLDQNLRTQRYMRSHKGKLPPPDESLPP